MSTKKLKRPARDASGPGDCEEISSKHRHLLGLHDALNGDADAGRYLMAELAHLLRNGIGREDATLLASMLDRVAAGEDADVAMLVRQRGAPNNAQRDYWIASRVDEIIAAGESAAEAYSRIEGSMNKYHGDDLSAKRIKAIYLQWRAVLPRHIGATNADREAAIARLMAGMKKAQ